MQHEEQHKRPLGQGQPILAGEPSHQQGRPLGGPISHLLAILWRPRPARRSGGEWTLTCQKNPAKSGLL